MADGSILIDTHIDNAQAQKELAKLRKDIIKLQSSLGKKTSEQSAIAQEMQQADAAIESTYQNIKRLESELSSLEKINLSDNTSAEFFAAQTRIPQIRAELEAQYSALEKQGQAADKVAARYDKINSEVSEISSRLDEAKTRAGQLAQKVAGSGAASEATAKATGKATNEIIKFRKRILELTKSALIFSVLTKALTVMRNWLGRTVSTSEEAAAAIAAFKGSLQGLAAPILNSVIPALVKIVQVITQIISLISRGVSALFGMTNKQALSTAESLNAEQAALEGVGGAASDAEKQLASFDEINKLTEPSGGGGGGTSDLGATFEEIELPPWMAAAAEKLASAFEKLKDAWNGLKENETFQKIVDAVKELVVVAAETVIEGLARAIEIAGKALTMIDQILDGDFAGAFDTFLGLLYDVIKLISSPIQNAAEWLFGLFGIEYDWETAWDEQIKPWFTVARWEQLWEDVKTGISNGWNNVKTWWQNSALVKWWNDSVKPWFTKARWQQLWNDVKTGISNGWNSIVTWWKNSALVTWFNSDVKPWFTRDRWVQLWDAVKQAFTTGWNNISEWWKNSTFVKWWESDVKPWFSLSRWQQLWTEVKNGFTQGWQSIKDWWNTAISTWWSQNVAVWFTAEKWGSAMGGIKEAFGTAFKNAANKAIDVLNQMISWMNQKLKFTIPALTIMGETIWDAKSITLASIPSIPYLAQGAVIPPNREFMAVLGDQKSGTNVEAPLSTIEQAVRNVLGSGYGGKHTVIMEIDGREFGRVTYDAYNKESQRLGVSLGGA